MKHSIILVLALVITGFTYNLVSAVTYPTSTPAGETTG
jgi:hypothetical protein